MQVPSMSYPLIAEAALLSGPSCFHRYAPYMVYVQAFTQFKSAFKMQWTHSIKTIYHFSFKYFRHVINAFLLMYQIGGSCIYVVFMATNLQALINALFDTDIDVRLVMVIILLPLILINWVSSNSHFYWS